MAKWVEICLPDPNSFVLTRPKTELYGTSKEWTNSWPTHFFAAQPDPTRLTHDPTRFIKPFFFPKKYLDYMPRC